MTLKVGEHKEFKPFRAVGCSGSFKLLKIYLSQGYKGMGGGGGGGKQRQLQIFFGCVKCKYYCIFALKYLTGILGFYSGVRYICEGFCFYK